MEVQKKYSTYAEIDRDLELLKLERDIYYQKIFVSIDKTKDSVLSFGKIINVFRTVKESISGNYGPILKFVLPIVVGWFINKKRGN